MRLIDTHCHLCFPAYQDDVDQVIQRAQDQEVQMITLGVDLETSQQAVELAQKYKGVYAGIGLHPAQIAAPGTANTSQEKTFQAEKYQQLLASTDKVVAAGEMGLDYSFFDKLPAEKRAELKQHQQAVFRRQLRWAQSNNLPVVIHNRDSHQDTLQILAEEAKEGRTFLRGVAHFFTGTKEQAQRYFELGFLVSFTGVITLTSRFNDLIRELPLERIMVETDSPYAAPAQYRGQRNEPAYVVEVARKIAELKGLPLSTVAKATTQNAKKLFGV